MKEETKLPRPTLEVVEKIENCFAILNKLKNDDEYWKASEEMSNLQQEWDWSNYTFTDPTTGKMGVKDVTGKVLVPAEYDGFNDIGSFFHHHETPKPTEKEGKFGLITGDGTNVQLCDFNYRIIATYPNTKSLFVFIVNRDANTFGILNSEGTELVPSILTSFHKLCNGILTLESNGKYGVIDVETHDVILPQYDYADCSEIEGKVIFTKDGVKGYVNTHNEFVSIEYYDAGNFDVEESFFAMYEP